MGTTPSFNTVYGKNDKDERVALGIKFNGRLHPGITHPSQATAKPKAKESTTESTKPKRKSFGLRRNKSNR